MERTRESNPKTTYAHIRKQREQPYYGYTKRGWIISMVKKIAIFLFLFLFVSMVGAVEIPAQQINQDLNISQECNNCTSCNFTRVTYNGKTLFSNLEATKDGTHYYYLIEAGNITDKGLLTYCYTCGNAVQSETGCLDIPLTYNGKQLSTQTSMLYLGLIVFLVFIFILLLVSLNYIPKDVRDDEGFIMEVSKLAYIRPVIKGVAWITLTSIVFIASNIAIAYLDTGLLGTFLFAIFRIMFSSNLVILPLCVIYMIQRITMSKEMLGLIERGVRFT